MSFGSTGFGSSGFGTNNNNNNNNNQNQQSGSLFGSGGGGGGGFGSNTNTGFGSSTNTGFGNNSNSTGGNLFGSNTSTTSGFGGGGGGFGSTNNNASNTNTTSLFGGGNATTNRPAFGSTGTTGSLFGGSNNTGGGFGGGSGGTFGTNTGSGSGSGFGSGNTAGSSLFGNTANNTTSGFGSTSNTGGGLFGGANPASSSFGGGSGGFSGGFGGSQQPASQNPGTGQVTNFQPTSEKEGTMTANFQSVGFQPTYQNWSFDELRMQDYDQGRKFGNQGGQGGAFGTSSGFGGTSTNNTFPGPSTGGSFGSGGAFGSNASQNTSGGFGQQNSGFGGNTGGGLFGQQQSSKPTMFGSTTSSTQPSGGLFGTANNTSTGNTGGSLFGGSNTGGSFGTQNKSGFGAGTSGFGGNTSTANSLFGGSTTGGFGAQNQQNSQSQTGGFGGGFGANNNNTNANNNTAGKSLFGGTSNAGGSSLFGSNQNQQQPSNLFGQSNNQGNTGNSLFGSKPAGNSLFGNQPNNQTNTGSNLFGNNQNQGQQASTGGLFGQPKPGGLFGGSSNTNTGFGGSSFGQTLSQNNNQQPAGSGLFGSANQNQSQLGGSLFGGSQQQQAPQQAQQPQQLNASMMNPYPYGHEQLFADLGTPEKPVGPIATPLSSSQRARRPAPLPAYKINPSASMRLITPQKRPNTGYGFSYSAYGTPSSTYSTPSYSGSLLSAGQTRTLNKSMSVGNMRNADDGLFRPDAFSPSLRPTSGRGSMKRLHIDRSLRTSFLSEEPDNAGRSPLRKTVSFDNQATPEANGNSSNALIRREDEELDQDQANGYLRSSVRRAITNGDAPAAEMVEVNGSTPQQRRPDITSAKNPPQDSQEHAKAASQARANQDDQPPGSFWSIPTIAELRDYSREELKSVKGFTVGRYGIGKIVYDNVNLQNVPLNNILGNIVDLKMRQATVYPNEASKPPAGKDLNAPATVYLENSWPRSQRGRNKVFAKSGPQLQRHLERLQSVRDSEFKNYDPETGTWQFKVQHFSTYQLDYIDADGLSSSLLSAPPESVGNSMMSQEPNEAGIQGGSSLFSNGTASRNSGLDDTFAFRRSRKSMPGGFDPFEAEFAGLEEANTMNSVDEAALQIPEPRQRSQPASDMEIESTHEDAMAGDYPSNLDGTADGPPYVARSTCGESLITQPMRKSAHPERQPFTSSQKNLIDLEEDSWAGRLQQTLSPKKQDRQALRETQGHLLQNWQPGVASPMKKQVEDVPFSTHFDVMNSLFNKAPTSISQRGTKQTAGGKGFKLPHPKRPRTSEQAGDVRGVSPKSSSISWTTKDTLLIAASRFQSSRRPGRVSKSTQPRLAPRQVFPSIESPETFAMYRSNSEVSNEATSDIPRAEASPSLSFAALAGALSTTVGPSQTNEKEVWDLLQILFDSQDPSQGTEVTSAHRKSLLSQFWKSIVTPEALSQAQRAQNLEEKSLAQLSANDIWGATESLLAGGNPKLATMVSQIDAADEGVQHAIYEQINYWRDVNSLSEIPHQIRALYELLAGNTCTAEGKSGQGAEDRAENFNISARFGLGWRRSFGLRLWYATLRNEPIETAIELYKNDLGSYQEQVRPVPEFDRNGADKGWDDPDFNARTDVLYSLLNLYAATQTSDSYLPTTETADLLAPENVTGNPLDARLSFLLCQTLLAHGLITTEPTEPYSEDIQTSENTVNIADNITSTFLAQLSQQSEDLVPAVFVALHLTHAPSRYRSITDLLTRHAATIGASADSCQTWQALVGLKIPDAWIWQAKATYARTALHDEKSQCLFLLRAGELVQACDVLRSVVAPGAVVTEDLLPTSQDVEGDTLPGDLRSILKEFEEDDEATNLTEWKDDLGGSIYVSYVSLIEKVERHRKSGRVHWNSSEAKELRNLIGTLQRALPNSDDVGKLGLQERVAAWEMRRVVEGVSEGLRGQEDGMALDGDEGEGENGGVMSDAERLSEGYYKKVGRA